MSVEPISPVAPVAATSAPSPSPILTTTTVYNLDCSDTIVVTDSGGVVISSKTIPSVHPPATAIDSPVTPGADHAIDVVA